MVFLNHCAIGWRRSNCGVLFFFLAMVEEMRRKALFLVAVTVVKKSDTFFLFDSSANKNRCSLVLRVVRKEVRAVIIAEYFFENAEAFLTLWVGSFFFLVRVVLLGMIGAEAVVVEKKV